MAFAYTLPQDFLPACVSHWLSLGFQNLYSQELECDWSSLPFHVRSCPWPLACLGPMDVTWSSRQQEPRVGPFPLEQWASGCSGTDWYLKANRVSTLIALHGGPETQSGCCTVIASGCVQSSAQFLVPIFHLTFLLIRTSEESVPLTMC